MTSIPYGKLVPVPMRGADAGGDDESGAGGASVASGALTGRPPPASGSSWTTLWWRPIHGPATGCISKWEASRTTRSATDRSAADDGRITGGDICLKPKRNKAIAVLTGARRGV